MKKHLLAFFFLASASALLAQDTASTVQEYDRMKRAGLTPVMRHVEWNTARPGQYTTRITPAPLTTPTSCQCMLPVDTSFDVVPITIGTPPDYRNDDGSTTLIPIPFTFCFYGQNQTSCYINNNGNISFGAPYGTFSAVGFPSAQFSMVAPFWADVDTRDPGSGLVYYKITNTALIVRWQTVGYYGMHSDLLNDFQLIITDGTDPLIPGGNNVSFCYGDMQWTTGDASQGVGGFGGVPATVGANLGNGIDYIQFGQFDHAGTGYDGPLNNPDGVSWLDNQNFVFNTCNIGNIPPIPNLTLSGTSFDTLTASLSCGDTLTVCEGNIVNFTATFFAPEATQTVTATGTGPSGFSIVNNVSGTAAIITAQLVTSSANVGYNTITFTGTDNGTPAQSSTVSMVIQVTANNITPPVISGLTEYCQGNPGVTLSIANNNYDTIFWSNGVINNTTISNVTNGQYFVTVGDSNGCYKRDTITVFENPTPVPVISGILNFCGNTTVLSAADPAYVSYNWSNNDTTSSVTVGSGTYVVTVTDTNGCVGPSNSVTVSANPQPNAVYSSTPQIGFPDSLVNFLDQSTVANPGNIVAWFWQFGDGDSSTVQNPSHTYQLPGTYPVCLFVTTSTPCYDTVCYDYVVQPFSVTPPNIFTPDGDPYNEYLVFKNLNFFPNANLLIYDRWGKKVYEDSNYQNNWNGAGMVDGVYYYVLTAPTFGKPIAGFFHIIRGK